MLGTPGFDLLRVPLVGRFLKWRHARLAMQVPMAALAGVLIFDGLRGPQVGAMNLAGVLPWIHWRGLLILGFLVAGNFFCMACPFLLPRTLARRWLPTGRHWPRWLRSKWLSVVLLVLFLWAYEAFSLWDSPWWTAWLALGYFVAAFVIDGFFRDAAFCKYVCPIGQFNFVQSLVSPLEVKVRDPAVCATCRTKDCIRGRDGDSRLRVAPVPAAQDRQHGLHVLSRLRPRLPAPQRRHSGQTARQRPLARREQLRSRFDRQAPRPGGPHRDPGVWRFRQRGGDGCPGLGVARSAGVARETSLAAAGNQPVLPLRPARAALGGRRLARPF